MKRLLAMILAVGIPAMAMAEEAKDASQPEQAAEKTEVVAEKKESDNSRYNYAGMRIAKGNLYWDTYDTLNTYHLHQTTGPIGFGALIGHRFNEDMRMDLEFDYIRSSHEMPKIHEKDTFSAMTAMANFYWNWSTYKRVYPYLGVGIGASSLSLTIDFPGYSSFEDSGFQFAYQFSTGLGFVLTDSLDFDAGLRYRNFGTVRNSNVYGVDYKTDFGTWQWYVGLVYKW